MWHLQTDYRYPYLAAWDRSPDLMRYLFCKYHHISKRIVFHVEDIVYLCFRDDEDMSLPQWLDVQKSQESVVLSYFMARDVA